MLEFVKGNFFEAPADIRVNTVNCVGVMGAGVALAFKLRYPEMFRDYQRDCRNGQVRPGTMHVEVPVRRLDHQFPHQARLERAVALREYRRRPR